jgi:hypothetical protein
MASHTRGIGVNHNLTHSVQDIADRKPLEQLAATRFGLLARLHSLAKDLQLDDAERPLDAKHQLVIEKTQIIDLLLVGDERLKKSGTLRAAGTSLYPCGIAGRPLGCRRLPPPLRPPS